MDFEKSFTLYALLTAAGLAVLGMSIMGLSGAGDLVEKVSGSTRDLGAAQTFLERG